MLFPSHIQLAHAAQYRDWIGLKGRQVTATTQIDRNGNPIKTETRTKPTMLENLRFFIDYQLNYMYLRYFMWNFVGRQNDIQGQGEITHGNWVSGIPFIDNPRLGDQSLLPADLTNRQQRTQRVLHAAIAAGHIRAVVAGVHRQARHRAVLGDILPLLHDGHSHCNIPEPNAQPAA